MDDISNYKNLFKSQIEVLVKEKMMTKQDIAEFYGIPVSAVRSILNSYGLQSKSKHEKLVEQMKDYAKNHTTKEVIDHFGITPAYARTVMRDNEIVTTTELTGRQKEIIDLYNKGYAKSDISRIVGCTKQNVYDSLNRHSEYVTDEIRGRRLATKTERKIEFVKRLIEEGKSRAEIARETELEISSLYQFCKKYNLDLPKCESPAPKSANTLKILDMYKNGVVPKDIAAIIDCTIANVYNTLHRNGIYTNAH